MYVIHTWGTITIVISSVVFTFPSKVSWLVDPDEEHLRETGWTKVFLPIDPILQFFSSFILPTYLPTYQRTLENHPQRALQPFLTCFFSSEGQRHDFRSFTGTCFVKKKKEEKKREEIKKIQDTTRNTIPRRWSRTGWYLLDNNEEILLLTWIEPISWEWSIIRN